MGPFTRELSNVDESYIGQLMGYSLRSFSNHVAVGYSTARGHKFKVSHTHTHTHTHTQACAPLYSTPSVRNNYDVGIAEGRCVVLHKNLSDSVLQVSQGKWAWPTVSTIQVCICCNCDLIGVD